MALFEGECFEHIINNGFYAILQCKPLYTPGDNISIKRDENLQIYLTTTSNKDLEILSSDNPEGTVEPLDNSLDLICKVTGHKITVKNIISKEGTHNFNDGIYKVVFSVQFVEANFKPADSGCYLFEWIQNIDGDCYHKDINLKDNIQQLSLSFDEKNLKFLSKITQGCTPLLHLRVNEHELWVYNDKNKKGHGFILYKGCPCESEREKIRDCISFFLGRPLIYLGNTILDRECSLVSFSAISPNNYTYKIKTTNPPILFDEKRTGGRHRLNTEKINLLINGLYNIYDDYNLGHLFWIYWHAVCAPVHASSVQFGACLEAFIESIFRIEKDKIQTTILKKSDWTIFKEKYLKIINELKIHQTNECIIKNNVNFINQIPQKIKIKKIFEYYNLEFTDKEEKSWNRRNNAAHGKDVKDDDFANLIRENEVLKLLFHRLLIKISGGSDHYIDYFSLNYPSRALKDGIPSEKT